jgi:DNA-binding transcriptional MerR regulator
VAQGAPPAPDGKSPDAYRTISEVSDALGVPQHVLRFWETRFRELRPLKRGGNRRYYRPEDVALAASLKRLLHEEGYTVKGVQRLLQQKGARGLLLDGAGPAAGGAGNDAAAAAIVAPAAAPVPAALRARLEAIRDRLARALAHPG